jgi:H-type lectin domain
VFEKLVSFTKDVSDLSDKPVLSPAELKAQFDSAPDEVRQYLNKLIDALQKSTAGDSGAKNIGATSISGVTGSDVQSVLEGLKTYADGKYLSMAGQKVEIIEGTVAVFGGNTFTLSVTFPTAYASTPDVVFSRITQGVSYTDLIMNPYIHEVTNTGFKCRFNSYNNTQGFGTGTFKAKFLVIGK